MVKIGFNMGALRKCSNYVIYLSSFVIIFMSYEDLYKKIHSSDIVFFE